MLRVAPASGKQFLRRVAAQRHAAGLPKIFLGGQACGAFRHKYRLIHMPDRFGIVIQVRRTAPTQSYTQSPGTRKCLMLQGKKSLVHSGAPPLSTTTTFKKEFQ
jgi:hypothetical protein